MALFKNLGTAAAGITGFVIGGTIARIGDALGNDFVKEIGRDVFLTTTATGATIGQAADGVVGVVGGMVASDSSKVDSGFSDIGSAINRTITGVGNGLKKAATNSKSLITGFIEGDEEQVSDSAKNLIKTAAIATLAIGVIDILDGGLIDSDDTGSI